MKEPVYTVLSRNPDRACLTEAYEFKTGIRGFSGELLEEIDRCELRSYGTLVVYPGFIWDFGSGEIFGQDISIDDRSMRTASLAHDALCRMTDRGVVPWKVRRKSDAYFRKVLQICGSPRIRAWWCWVGVRLGSRRSALRNKR